jgi:hypothetical protein
MANLQEFTIIPILGRKTSVAQGDLTLLKPVGEGIALTHDVGGLNFDTDRKVNTCSKSYGYTEWSSAATAQATKCLGLFELYDGTNRDWIYFDNGKFYVYNTSTYAPVDKTAGGVTHATDNIDLYCAIRVGAHVVFADRAETTPYVWKRGDAAATKLITAGTEFKFRYLTYFMNRIIGLYSDQTNGDIDMRWSAVLPDPGTTCEFAATNQIYAPNDDPIVGVSTMGRDRCYVYSENSIHAIAYYPDYTLPFRAYTIVPKRGAVNHHSIVNLGHEHYFFNKNYGFCKYEGGNKITPIGDDIEIDMQGINSAYYNLIVGTFVPLTRSIVWTVPVGSSATANRLIFYNIDTKQWRFEDKAMRYVDVWNLYQSYTWDDLIAELGGTGALWSAASSNTWAYYSSERQRLVYSNTDGKLYNHMSATLDGSGMTAYRIEPIMDFGDKHRRDFLQEIWFDITESVASSIKVYYRGGSTVGEVEAATWSTGTAVSINSPDKPVLNVGHNNKLHQIKWGVESGDAAGSLAFAISGITFRFIPGSRF